MDQADIDRITEFLREQKNKGCTSLAEAYDNAFYNEIGDTVNGLTNYLLNIIGLSPQEIIDDYAQNHSTLEQDLFNGCECDEFCDIHLPPNITDISDDAFNTCQWLRSIEGVNVHFIGSEAFEDCENLESVKFPNLIELGEASFQYCRSLSSADFPELTEVPDSSFYQCRSLSAINLPNVTEIGSFAFMECNLTTVDLPNVSTIESEAFSVNPKLSHMNAPKADDVDRDWNNGGTLVYVNFESLTEIVDDMFYDDTELETIICPNVYSIGHASFANCRKLKNISLPKVEEIGSCAFEGCDSLTKLSLPSIDSSGLEWDSFHDCNNLTLYLTKDTIMDWKENDIDEFNDFKENVKSVRSIRS